jgi:D-serine deaminase-like pyridoxal phosphate-dependent protein
MDDAPSRYRRYANALRGEPLPVAMVDLDAVDGNVDAILAPVRAAGKTLRLASKSIRCVELLRYVARRGGAAVRGVMAFSPLEACFLVDEGFGDVLVAYPTAQVSDVARVAEKCARGASIALVVDAPEHLEIAGRAAREAGARVRVVVDVDLAYRPLGARLHVGVRRSPLGSAAAVADLAERAASTPGLAFGGLMAYEAHIAGVGDDVPGARLANAAKRAMKRAARAQALALRAEVASELERRGLAIAIFNGGGTGSVGFSARDPSLTEVTAGSGFLDAHLFDHYAGLDLEPAAAFALQVTRRPAPGLVTCQSGGFVASGAAGPDRLPRPWLPEGLRLLGLEGAGEVQTPLEAPPGLELALGAPVFFRHAKAGELAEHFTTYVLVRGERVEDRVPTYRGQGVCFW